MNNVDPPSRFTACILLHTYTQERLQSSAESAFTGDQQHTVPAARKEDALVRVGAGSWTPPRENSRSSLLALAAGLLEIVYDGGIGEGRDIAKVVFAFGHVTEDAAHDLAA